jgi:hypothetical protein
MGKSEMDALMQSLYFQAETLESWAQLKSAVRAACSPAQKKAAEEEIARYREEKAREEV